MAMGRVKYRLFLVIFIIAITAVTPSYAQPADGNLKDGLPDTMTFNIEVTDGTKSVTLSYADLKAMDFVELNNVVSTSSTDSVAKTNDFIGVPLMSIMNSAGAPSGSFSYKVTAIDGYTVEYTQAQFDVAIVAFKTDGVVNTNDINSPNKITLVVPGSLRDYWPWLPVKIQIIGGTLLSSPTPTPTPAPMSIVGIVTDRLKNPIPDVNVTLYSNGAIVTVPRNPQQTKAIGQYSFNGVQPGNYTVTAVYQNVYSFSQNVNYSGGIATVNIAFTDLVYTPSLTTAPTSVMTDARMQALKPEANKYAYIPVQGKDVIAVIDVATGQVLTSIRVEGGAFGIAVNPNGTKIYATNFNSPGIVYVIGAVGNHDITLIPVGEYPSGIAINTAGTRAYVTYYNTSQVTVIDTVNNTVIENIPAGKYPFGVVVNPNGTRVYVTNQEEGTVSVIDAGSNTVIATVPASVNVSEIAVSPDGAKVYTASFTDNVLYVIDAATNTVTARIPVGEAPWGVAISPDGTNVYVTNQIDWTVSVVSVTANTVTTTIPVGSVPMGIAVTPDGKKILVATTNGMVAIIDAATNEVNAMVASGGDYLYGFGQFIGPGEWSGFRVPTVEQTVEVVAPIAVGVVMGLSSSWIVTFLGKLFGFIYEGVKSVFQKFFGTIVNKYRKPEIRQRKGLLFNISITEIFVGIACALLIGITFAYARGALSDLDKVAILILAAAFTIVVSELVRRYYAARYSVPTEYQFWGIGTVTLIVTAVLHQPFARPARTIVEKESEIEPQKLGIIALAPCVASFVVSIAFLLLMAYGNGFDELGREGFKMGMMICVYSLMPLEPMDGKRVMKWSRTAWGFVFVPALLLYLGVTLFTY